MTTDYNDGNWHGWNGGECPVHPMSKVEGLEASGGQWVALANGNDWQLFRGAFRVVKPYVAPTEYSGECYAYHYTNLAPTLCGDTPLAKSMPGKWTATHTNGKLSKITWEATE